MLDQVKTPDLAYDEAGKMTEGVAETGALDEAAGKYIRCNTWHGSNAAEAVGSVSIVLFTGGEGINPTLYYAPEAVERTDKTFAVGLQFHPEAALECVSKFPKMHFRRLELHFCVGFP